MFLPVFHSEGKHAQSTTSGAHERAGGRGTTGAAPTVSSTVGVGKQPLAAACVPGATTNVGVDGSPQTLYSFYLLRRQFVIYGCKWVTAVRASTETAAAAAKKQRPEAEANKLPLASAASGSDLPRLVNDDIDHKLLSGLLFSIQTFCRKISPEAHGKARVGGSASTTTPDSLSTSVQLSPVSSFPGGVGSGGGGSGFAAFVTPFYKLHYFETPTSIKLALITAPHVPNQREILKQLYVEVVVPIVTRMPRLTIRSSAGDAALLASIMSPLLEGFLMKRCPQLFASTSAAQGASTTTNGGRSDLSTASPGKTVPQSNLVLIPVKVARNTRSSTATVFS